MYADILEACEHVRMLPASANEFFTVAVFFFSNILLKFSYCHILSIGRDGLSGRDGVKVSTRMNMGLPRYIRAKTVKQRH